MIFVGPYSKMRHNSDNVQLSMPWPFGRFGMLHKISKKSLDDYVLDAKVTMQKIQQFQQKKGVALSRPFRWSEKLETYFPI